MKCFLDGNALCIVANDFQNLMESPAVFIILDEDKLKEVLDIAVPEAEQQKIRAESIIRRVKEEK